MVVLGSDTHGMSKRVLLLSVPSTNRIELTIYFPAVDDFLSNMAIRIGCDDRHTSVRQPINFIPHPSKHSAGSIRIVRWYIRNKRGLAECAR